MDEIFLEYEYVRIYLEILEQAKNIQLFSLKKSNLGIKLSDIFSNYENIH